MSWLLRELRGSSVDQGTPAVSVAVPCLNGGERLLELVAALGAQDVPFEFEILLADSGSDDGVFERLRVAGPALRRFRVAPRRFNHGRTPRSEAAPTVAVSPRSQRCYSMLFHYLLFTLKY